MTDWNLPCHFPFRYNNGGIPGAKTETYNYCTTDGWKKTDHWCALKVYFSFRVDFKGGV